MVKLLYAGFDKLDIALTGAFPQETLDDLLEARELASKMQKPTLVSIGPGKVHPHVLGHGSSGGYAFILDTGPVGENIFVKNNAKPNEWNLLIKFRSATLLEYGFEGIKERLFQQFDAMGAHITGMSINRIDYAMDFLCPGFELHMNRFVAPSGSTKRPHFGDRDTDTAPDPYAPSPVMRGRRLETMTVGKMPGRQVTVYDKRKDAMVKRKWYWFETWGFERGDPRAEVWRVEIRAGKKELKDNWNMRTFEDVEASLGDVMIRAASKIRYVADDTDTATNVGRLANHTLWDAVQSALHGNLYDFRSGLVPGRILDVEIETLRETYKSLILGNAMAYAVAAGMPDEDIMEHLQDVVGNMILTELIENTEMAENRLSNARKT